MEISAPSLGLGWLWTATEGFWEGSQQKGALAALALSLPLCLSNF